MTGNAVAASWIRLNLNSSRSSHKDGPSEGIGEAEV
jgi:hypothetical protein